MDIATKKQKALYPLGVKEWVIRLGKYPLPILPHTGADLLEQLQNPDISLNQVAAIVEQDPVLTLHLLRQANRLNESNSRKQTDIHDIHHAISLLGLTNIQKLSRQIPILKPNFEEIQTQNYLSAICRSAHAAKQAAHWAKLRHYHAPHEIYLSALLYGVPMWCLWQFAYHEMELIHHLMTKERIPKEEAELAVLGCTTSTLSQVLVKSWKLPEIVREAMNPKNQPNNRFIVSVAKKSLATAYPELPPYDPNGVTTNSPAVMVLFSNWLAAETYIDFYSRQTERCVRVVSAFLRKKTTETEKLIRDTAIETSREFPIPGVVTPGEKLLFLPGLPIRRRIKMSQLAEMTKKLHENWEAIQQDSFPSIVDYVEHKEKAAPSQKSKPQEFNEKVLHDFLRSLKESPKDFTELNSLLDMLCQSLHFGIGIPRVMAATLRNHNTELVTQHFAGLDGDDSLRHLVIELQPTNLFTKLVRQPAALLVDRDHNTKAFAQIPISIKTVIQTNSFMVHSLFRGPTPIGIVYGDYGQGMSKVLDPVHYNLFKLGCNSVCQHLSQHFQ